MMFCFFPTHIKISRTGMVILAAVELVFFTVAVGLCFGIVLNTGFIM